MNEITFNGEGPVMSGTWYNPSNGDSFTVKETYFQDNQLIVETTDGRMLNYDMTQNYVKSDRPLPMTKKSKSSQLPPEVESLIDTNSNNDNTDGILAEDLAMIQGTPTATSVPTVSATIADNTVTLDKLTEDQRLIQRVLKRATDPNIDAKIKWTKFPQKQIECLVDMMGVDVEDIVNYYISKLDINTIKSQLAEQLENSINESLGLDEAEPIVVEKKTTAKTTKKKK